MYGGNFVRIGQAVWTLELATTLYRDINNKTLFGFRDP